MSHVNVVPSLSLPSSQGPHKVLASVVHWEPVLLSVPLPAGQVVAHAAHEVAPKGAYSSVGWQAVQVSSEPSWAVPAAQPAHSWSAVTVQAEPPGALVPWPTGHDAAQLVQVVAPGVLAYVDPSVQAVQVSSPSALAVPGGQGAQMAFWLEEHAVPP